MTNYTEHKGKEQGILRLSGKQGFVILDSTGDRVEIDTTNLNTALHGDTVEILLSGTDNKEIGRVLQVLKRAKTEFVGTVQKENGICYIDPDNRKMYTDIVISPEDGKSLRIGDKVLAQITKWTDPKKNPIGKIIEVIGPKGENETEMRAIALDCGFKPEFPPEVEEAAKILEKNFKSELESEIKTRRDFRKITTFTIDPKTAKDFDDALSFRKISDDEFEVGIHIADVSHYVQPGTTIDKEAAFRATSVYLVDRTIPMLPEVLSNNICSLRPDEERLAYSAVFVLNKKAEIKNEWFGRTVIKSDRRFTYEEAQEVLDNKRNEYTEEITTLNTIAYELRRKKIENGAITFEDSEVEFELDEKGKPIGVRTKERTDSHKLIEDFMLLANRKVAEFVSKKGSGKENIFIYRVHDIPDMEKITGLKNFLKPFGFNLKISDDKIRQRELNRILDEVDESAQGPIVQRAAIRAMAKAVYSVTNIGHWGLAFEYYTHFTSPIRRYPDLMVHRLLSIYLDNKKPKLENLKNIARDVLHSTDMEIRAAEAERDSIKLKQVEYMEDKIGQEFTGVISGVTKWGIFVEEEETKADGMVRMENLGDDYFILDEKNYSIFGKKTGKKFRLGDKIKFKIIGADPIRKTLDYKVV